MNESIIEGRRAAETQGLVLPAAVAAVLAAGLAAWGTFGEGGNGVGEYLIILAIIAVATAVVFGWLVPRALRHEEAGATALVLSILGLGTIAVFWTGLPPVLAMGGLVLGWAGRDASRRRALSIAAAAIGAFALVANVVLYIQDMAF
ncbi:MAG: hypothetical protein ICV67_04965 [Thermoleophilia bacterium]|nr:hypothetical protein [Thermoleophilia bacterium]